MKVLLSLAALIFCASAMDNVTFLESRNAFAKDDEKVEELGGLEDSADDFIVLTSRTDEENSETFEISRDAAMMSGFVKNIIEGDQTAGAKEQVEARNAEPIEVKQVSAPTLQLIAEYLQHHNGTEQAEIAKPIRDTNMEKIVQDPFDAKFINKQTKKVIFKIILGANSMACQPLLHLGCAKIATLIKGKSPEEIKKILGADDDASQDDKVTSRRLMDLLRL
jgi:S-phase kinase-associated protein 1